jgi:lysocardiolipin and lysophospholipid acyltransferase
MDPTTIRVHLLHAVSFATLTLCSCYFGIFPIYLPVLPLLAVSTKLFDKWNEMMIGTWFRMVAGYLELVYRMKVVVTGDNIPWNEGCILIMNHRTQMDWILLWNLLARFGDTRHCKIILKNSLKGIPGPGWAMQQAMFLFLARKWEKDRHHFNAMLTYFVETNKPVQILLFPEGTDYCEGTKKRSDEYAKKNNLPLKDYILYPRTKGFAELVKGLRHGNIKSVVDLTIGYPVNIPWGFKSFVCGNFPEEVHFDIKRYPIGDMPKGDTELQEWCSQRFEEKEEVLKGFYSRGRFDKPPVELVVPEAQIHREMLLCLISWITFIIVTVTLVFVSSLWRWVCILGSAVYVGLTAFGGLEKTVLDAHNRMRSSPDSKKVD